MAKHFLYPTSYTNVGGRPLSPIGAASVYECVDDPANSPDGDTTRANQSDDGGVQQTHRFGLSAMVPANLVNYVKIHNISKESPEAAASIQNFVYVGSTYYPQGSPITLTASYLDWTDTVTLNPATGVKWTEADLNALEAGWVHYVGEYGDDTTSFYVEVDYVPAPIGLEPAREAASRRQWFRKHPPDIIKVRVPLLLAMQADPMTLLPMSHIAGPQEAGEGWGIEKWKRRPTLVLARTLHPDHGELTLMDLRRHLCLYRDDAWATVRAGLDAAGIARFANASVTRTYSRDSSAWIPNPAGGKILEVTADLELHAQGGDLFEAAATNLNPYSSFHLGSGTTFTGWTWTPGGNTIAEETGILLFEAECIPRCPRFTAANPLTAGYTLAGTTFTLTTPWVGVISIDHYDFAAGAPLWYNFRRSIDLAYWRESDQTWQAATTWNPMTESVGAWGRHVTKIVDIGLANTDVRLRIGMPLVGGVAGQINLVGHTQIESGYWASSRIVTGAATVTRAASRLLISNNSTGRVWQRARGAFACQIVPEWNSADLLAGTILTVVYAYHSADEYDWLYYAATGAKWVFRRRVAGVNYDAELAAAVTRGTPVTLVARWCGADAELGKAAYTSTLFVDWVQGSEVASAVAPTEVATADLEPGSWGAADHFSGQIRLNRTYAHVPTNAECARLP